MVYHILNGDSLAYGFPIAEMEGGIIVTREALVDGDLTGSTLNDFWQTRANYLDVSDENYYQTIVKEFEKILTAPAGTEFNLWFEYDLFCQVNMWFVCSLLYDLPINKIVYAVYTIHLDKSDGNFWNGFGKTDPGQLISCLDQRIRLHDSDIQFGRELWRSYKNNDLRQLTRLSKTQLPAFPYIQEVIQAHIDRFPENGERGRPEKVVRDITKNISKDFNKVFTEFRKRESIYGFGDVQLKKIYDRVMLQE